MNTLNTQQQDIFGSLGLSTSQPEAAGPENDPSKLGLETFLKLMVTQLNNQDPFKPMENGEFLGQIAQFGAVTGLDKLNQQMTDLGASLTSGQALQAGTMVGREVLVPSSIGVFEHGKAIRGQVDLAESSPGITVRIYDKVGQLVREMPLGAKDSGTLHFAWDGKGDNGDYVAAGTYRVRVSSNTEEQEIDLQAQMFAQVESVNLSAGNGLTLNLQGLGPVAFNDVKQIY